MDNIDKQRPEWAPNNAGKEFASFVMPAIYSDRKPKAMKVIRKLLNAEDYIEGILRSDLPLFSKAITLVESNREEHFQLAQDVIKGIMPQTGNSIRIGITGAPGAGKSTFIEALGTFLCRNGLKVAVLAIDPSSTLTRGSILGDKTRMELLSREKNAFIRPSPSCGTLGGVARKTRETILLCEAAGYEVILIETIGVGQSEVTVRSMVDLFLLLLIPGSGDELQGIKKGVVELADMLIVNKADGDNIQRANLTKHQYSVALQMLQPATVGWKTIATTVSAATGAGISDVWTKVNQFIDLTKQNGVFDSRRNEQLLEWVHSILRSEILLKFYNSNTISNILPEIEQKVISGEITPTIAVANLLNNFFNSGS